LVSKWAKVVFSRVYSCCLPALAILGTCTNAMMLPLVTYPDETTGFEMKHINIFTSSVVCVISLLGTSNLGAAEHGSRVIEKIAFGSCNSQHKPQPLWTLIKRDTPDLWIWTGDNVYADTESFGEFRKAYDLQLSNQDYRAFVEEVPFLIGTWDDHDYGVNDGGSEFAAKRIAKQELYRFLGVEASHPSWDREGVYQSYEFGPTGQIVKIILLDTRWFRDPILKDASPDAQYLPNDSGTLLGIKQWEWLTNELKENAADLTIIVSSIQLLAAEHRFEKWANFPNERSKLLKLINDYASEKTIVISGDRHAGEISAVDLPSWEKPLLDITSSGLTNVWSRNFDESNSLAITEKIIKPNYGFIEIDWNDASDPDVRISIKGLHGEFVNVSL
jgi:alkaline phosphatase D